MKLSGFPWHAFKIVQRRANFGKGIFLNSFQNGGKRAHVPSFASWVSAVRGLHLSYSQSGRPEKENGLAEPVLSAAPDSFLLCETGGLMGVPSIFLWMMVIGEPDSEAVTEGQGKQEPGVPDEGPAL